MRAPLVPPRSYKLGDTYWIKRLNTLLRFADEDLGVLTDDAWEELLDQLYESIYGAKRDRANKGDIFNKTANRKSIREAQRGLAHAIKKGADEYGDVRLELAKQRMGIGHDESLGFYHLLESDHLPTTIYGTFAILLEASCIRRSDAHNCANDKCGRYFVPLRKVPEKKPAYCSTKCANRMAAIRYRKAHGPKLKARERDRSKKRYMKKSLSRNRSLR